MFFREAPVGRSETPESVFQAAASARETFRRLPTATYRVQFNRDFTFDDARRIVSYLDDLGITDVYASPYLMPRPGSPHGYDVCDHNHLNPDLGPEEDYNHFVAELKRRGMGQVLDVVPNHMAIGDRRNGWWMDVLENGPNSPYAAFFDIEWRPLTGDPALQDKVLLPILGEPYGRVLENRELRLSFEEGAFFISYGETRLPVDPRSYVELLRFKLDDVARTLGADDEPLLELESIITALTHLPARTETDPAKVAEGRREKEVIKRRLASLCQACPNVRTAIGKTVHAYNGRRGDPRSFDHLDRLLDQQVYRLAYWRVAAEEINYRRFFDINHLAAIRMENPPVFRETHRLILNLLRTGKVTGLRIDHIDGLWDPDGYLRQLQQSSFLEICRPGASAGQWTGNGPTSSSGRQPLAKAARPARSGVAGPIETAPTIAGPLSPGRGRAEAPGGSQLAQERLARFDAEGATRPNGSMAHPLYVVVEKILGKGEELPADWPVAGTTGYEFANAVNGLFVDSANRKAFDDLYASFTKTRGHFTNLVNSSKKMIMLVSLVSEINLLSYQLKRIAARNRWSRDLTLNSLTFALREVIACLPVYRTYISSQDGTVAERDRAFVEAAVAEARKRNPRTAAAIFDFLRDILLLRYPENASEEDRVQQRNFVMRFQQITGPVMAKGLEDTACYVYNRLTSLNEVGSDPAQFGLSVAAFHRHNGERQRRWPHALSATSTHDSKRSEDVRARIDVLSEIPREWRAALTRWSRLNRKHKTMVGGQPAPDRNEEYLLYQTLLGTWPLEPLDQDGHRAYVERIQAYLLKASKEAKVNTSWINPNTAYEEALQRFIAAILRTDRPNPFLEAFRGLQRKMAHFGLFNALAQTLLKLTCPGVPDFYQGTEIWSFTLVDPDNRRPVDFKLRTRLLRDLRRRQARANGNLAALAGELVETKEDGRIKLYVTNRALVFRRDHSDLFGEGTYVSLDAVGSRADRLCAFARRHGDRAAVTVVPRLIVGLTGGAEVAPLGEDVWGDTRLLLPGEHPGQRYRNLFTGETLATVEHEGSAALPLGAVLRTFPVALLEREG